MERISSSCYYKHVYRCSLFVQSLVGEKFGMKNYGVNYGVTFIGYSAAAYFGPKFAVKVATANNGDFTKVFLIALGFSLAGILLTFVFRAVEKKK